MEKSIDDIRCEWCREKLNPNLECVPFITLNMIVKLNNANITNVYQLIGMLLTIYEEKDSDDIYVQKCKNLLETFEINEEDYRLSLACILTKISLLF
jgi:hypothetical protein